MRFHNGRNFGNLITRWEKPFFVNDMIQILQHHMMVNFDIVVEKKIDLQKVQSRK
jgi:hypothetical protein